MGKDMIRRWLFMIVLAAYVPLISAAQYEPTPLQWHRWEEGVQQVQASGKFLLVDVFTTWCGWCKKMDHTVYIHPRVQELLAAQFVPVKLNAESETVIANGANHYTERECAKLLNVQGYPCTLVFDSKFKLVARINGYHDAGSFIRFLEFVTGKNYNRCTFQQYLAQFPPG
jgi:thioredoxin-related protein